MGTVSMLEVWLSAKGDILGALNTREVQKVWGLDVMLTQCIALQPYRVGVGT